MDEYKKTLCYTCFGCNQLENKEFKGTYKCNNYICAKEQKKGGKNIGRTKE